jgi:hypothetical protein
MIEKKLGRNEPLVILMVLLEVWEEVTKRTITTSTVLTVYLHTLHLPEF